MKKLERRSIICLVLAAVLLLGLSLFMFRFATNGGTWATFYANSQIYTDGMLNRGAVFDRNDEFLMECTKDGINYNDNWSIRMATVHAVGDPKGNVATGAINMFKGQLIGYDILNGTYDTSKDGKKIKLTIDSKANVSAYNALNGKTGTVGVMNWKTGEIMCMVSTPAFDPAGNLPSDTDSSYYFNNFIMGTMTPGSTFKLITSAAVIDNLSNRDSFSFTCDGVNEFKEKKFTDVSVHGTVNFKEALAKSCNGAFGELTREVGASTMRKYVKKLGLTEPVFVNGVETAAGSFDFPKDDPVKLSWAGIGQAEDQVNPCAMLVYMGAIANNGVAIQPSLIKNATFLKEHTGGKRLGHYLDEETAKELRKMMKNNVKSNYGEGNYPGLKLYAKSGTAEVGDRSDAWFVGFIKNKNNPYAFVVWVKDGGFGSETAGPIARTVLNQLIADNNN